MSLRVTAGRFKGRRLTAPSSSECRPTMGRTREAIFSMLGPDALAGVEILDLFCGAGTLGIEAISRGAVSGVFVDSSKAAVAATTENLESCEATGCEVKLATVEQYLKGVSTEDHGRFGAVFLDPPYVSVKDLDLKLLTDKLRLLLTDSAFIVFESGSDLSSNLELPLLKERNYGDTTVKIYVTES